MPYHILAYTQGTGSTITFNQSDFGAQTYVDQSGLVLTRAPGGSTNTVRTTAAPKTSGKYYFEFTLTTAPTPNAFNQFDWGVSAAASHDSAVDIQSPSVYWDTSYSASADKIYFRDFSNGSSGGGGTSFDDYTEAQAQAFMNGKTIGILLDIDGGIIDQNQNIRSKSSEPLPAASSGWYPVFRLPTSSAMVLTINFGESPYYWGLPSGYSNWI